jgi:hypothetical protein
MNLKTARQNGNMVVSDAELREKMREIGRREMMRWSALSQHTIQAILNGKPVRRVTIQPVRQAVN